MEEIKNYGLLEDTRSEEEKAKDYQFGATTKIVPEVLQADGQWKDFLPTNEYQNLDGFDKMACVSFSAVNCLEILHKRKFGEEKNWSDRFTAKMSGTTREGNSLYNVAESLRKLHGEIRQDLWPNIGKTWEEFYSEIPTNIKGQALKSLDEYLIQYEWLIAPLYPNILMDALKYAPIQIGIYAYGVLIDGVHQKPVVGQGPNHAVTLIGYKEGEYWLIFDHYQGNEIRKLAWDYTIGFAMKFNITKKAMIFKKTKDQPHIYLIMNGKKVMLVDMPTLNALGDGQFEEVDSLAQYPDGGSLIWAERPIY
jgi:hypothetical protein